MTDTPTTPADEDLPTLQHKVQGMMGRCIIRLQQYEQLMKAVVAHHEISASGSPLKSDLDGRIADAGGKTLGTLVGTLLETYIVCSEQEIAAKPDPRDDKPSVKMNAQLPMRAKDFDKAQNDLKELVVLRNNLVHHFVEQHDLRHLNGCRGAQQFLEATYQLINRHYTQLRGWAEEMVRSKRVMAKFIQSDVFHDLVINGIAPDGSVDWPAAGIVCALREAADELAIQNWTSVIAAARWIAQRHPDQHPAKYGCKSWQQVIHESRLFELQYFETHGQREAWYRFKKS